MSVVETAKKIKALEIQGATNIAISAVQAFSKEIRGIKWENREKVMILVDKAIEALTSSRTTEPMMRNGLKRIKKIIVETDWENNIELINLVKQAENEVLMTINEAKEKIIEVGARRIENGDTILTHCHSSGVTGTILKAHQEGKRFKVIQTETRPKYQGRITANELIEAGVDTTMIIDSATRHYMKEINFVMVGCDAITSEGNIINKIGTSQVALAAWEARTPFYIVSSLLKFDPVTIHGSYETIEERDVAEIWETPPKGLKIRNPAFDVTRRDYIHGLITEGGIISPHSILEAIHRHYSWML
jgi:ribose 1,5-bisphosphate isomerase